MEEIIDRDVNETVRRVLGYLQAERERLVELRQKLTEENPSCTLAFEKNEEFDAVLARLRQISIGGFENPTEKGENLTNNEIEDHLAKLGGAAKSINNSSDDTFGYENLQVVAEFRGIDAFGSAIRAPTVITALPGQNCFALLHGYRISLISPLAMLTATYDVKKPNKVAMLPSGCSRQLFVNPLNGQLMCIDSGILNTIEPPYFYLASNTLKSRQRNEETFTSFKQISVEAVKRTAFGAAISTKTRQLFTASVNGSIVSYSLADGSQTGKWQCPFDATRVLGIGDHNNRLFLRSREGPVLRSVPISDDGTLEVDKASTFGEDLDQVDGVTFDNCGNVLIVDGHRPSLKVFSEKGDLIRAIFPRIRSFNPNGIAVLTAPPGEFYSFEGGKIQCTRLVAMPDRKDDRIVFFGSPVEKN